MERAPGLLGKKLGMTQIYLEDGTRVPVTVIAVDQNAVTAHRTKERDGYRALQLGFADQKASRLTKADLGRFKQAGVTPKKSVREFRVGENDLAAHPVGSTIGADLFKSGQVVDVTATSKGKGFAGVMKRHKLGGKPATHGTHEYFRHGGSIGCRLTPGRVHPGKRMAGQMGNERVTAQNLTVAKVLSAENVLLVRGCVPGPRGGIVSVRPAHKVAIRASHGG